MGRAGLDTDAVVSAAAVLADAEGLDALTLTRLADLLGVRPPSLYAHVGGLDDVHRRLGARGASDLGTALGHAVEGRSGYEALRALAFAYRDFARRNPGAYAALQRSRQLMPDPEARSASDAVVRVAVAALRGYGLEGDQAIHAVRLIRIGLHGFIALEAAGGFAIDLSPDETFERLLAMLDLGFRRHTESAALPATATRPTTTPDMATPDRQTL